MCASLDLEVVLATTARSFFGEILLRNAKLVTVNPVASRHPSVTALMGTVSAKKESQVRVVINVLEATLAFSQTVCNVIGALLSGTLSLET